MKIICNQENKAMIKEKLSQFEELNITLIEKKAQVQEVGIIFDENELDQLIEFLNHHFIIEKKKTLLGKLNGRTHVIRLEDVVYIEALQHDTFAYTNNDCFNLDQKLYQLEEMLYPRQFVRIAKSYMVNLMKVEIIEPGFNGRLILIMKNKIKLEVSRNYAKHVKQCLGMEKKQ